MKKSIFTPKQQLFIHEYLIDLNATQAAIRAGYSKKTAKSQGQRLLTHVDIAEAVERAMREREIRLQVDANWVLKRLVDEAEADIGDLFDDMNNIIPINEWPEVWRHGLVTGVDKDSNGKTKIRFSDRFKRLEMIGKHVSVQAFSDKVKLDGELGLKGIEVTFVKPEEYE